MALSADVTHALAHNTPTRAVSSALFVIYVIGLVLWIQAMVGTWRMADREQARNRLANLSNPQPLIAKGVIVLGAVDTGSRVVNDGPRLNAHLRTALDEQAASPFTVIPQWDSRATLFGGGISDGMADALGTALHEVPNATAAALRPESDWLCERTLVTDVTHRHHLYTHVERVRASACTITFLAGEDHAAAPGVRLGFHRLHMIGAEHDQSSDATDSGLWCAYSGAGLLDVFICRIQDISLDQM